MNIYLSERELTQQKFDKVKDMLQEHVINNGFGNIYLQDILHPKPDETLMEGYWDIDDEGQTTPHFWYNKKILDSHNIKY